ncbi:hypothetical protein EVI01_23820 [Enterococcus villorum]|uniref:Uncharacterized protein n=1 Tax=Enterococcus villorum TaxID=112904 RepID=A0A511J4W9_9ENTE|nr:hypothetical protein EVI01_23820 [Enterococcus villorum]
MFSKELEMISNRLRPKEVIEKNKALGGPKIKLIKTAFCRYKVKNKVNELIPIHNIPILE